MSAWWRIHRETVYDFSVTPPPAMEALRPLGRSGEMERGRAAWRWDGRDGGMEDGLRPAAEGLDTR